MGDNGKSLPDELVGDCNHGEFPGFSVAPKSGIGLLALCVEPAGRPRRHVKETSGVRVSVAVDVTSDVYRASGLFVGRTDSEIPGYLFGILEVGEPSGSDDKCRGERYAYALDGCQQRELSAELGLDKAGKFRLEPVAPLFQELDRFLYGMGCAFIRDRQTVEGASKVGQGRNLLGKLANDGSLLSEPQDSLSLHLEWLRSHLLSIEGYESGIVPVRLDRGEHGSGEVLYFQRVLHTDSEPGDVEHVQQQGTVIPRRLHDAVNTAVFGESPDELFDTGSRVGEGADFSAFLTGVSHHERGFTHVDSNVLHGCSVFSLYDIVYILVLHCQYGL